jgi:general secretion pathway protein I
VRNAFTLLEVMVAVAILGIALTAVFASQAGAVRAGQRARMTSFATLLARCKMGEIEEQVAKDGLPAISSSGSDRCCEGGEIDGFECDWRIERVVLPDVATDEEPTEGAADAATAAGGEEGGVPSMDELMAGTGMASGDVLGQMVMDFAYPILKPSIEEQVRRATVTVRWREGTAESREQSFDVMQYLVAEQVNIADEETDAPPP